MSSTVLFSAEYVPAIRRPEVRPAARPVRMQTVSWSWQAIGENASGILFLAVLGWEVWRIGSALVQFASQVAAARFGGPF